MASERHLELATAADPVELVLYATELAHKVPGLSPYGNGLVSQAILKAWIIAGPLTDAQRDTLDLAIYLNAYDEEPPRAEMAVA